ncbi:MAG: SH3 domain-containing protein [Thermodesulfobacteriota bacterium]
MRELLINFIPKALILIAFIFFSISCSAIDRAIHPDEKPTPPTWPTFEQILKEDYKGPKARVVVIKFIDKSVRGKEISRAGDGIAEMLRNAMLATNRYIVQVRKSLDEVIKSQDIGDSGRIKKEEKIDLLVEGIIKEFKHGIAGAGWETGGASYVTLIVTVTNPRTNQILATERVRGKATDFGGTIGKGGGGLPEVFKYFSKTPMEKAIRIAIEESASFVVAKTPPESYRVFPIIPPKETQKPPPVKVQPEVMLPPQPPVVTPKPTLPITQVIWAYVNLREGPGTNYKVIGNVKKGTSLAILEAKGNWLHVRLEDGSEAWVSKSATSEASAPPPSAPPPEPNPM